MGQHVRERESVCVTCVCERERERERVCVCVCVTKQFHPLVSLCPDPVHTHTICIHTYIHTYIYLFSFYFGNPQRYVAARTPATADRQFSSAIKKIKKLKNSAMWQIGCSRPQDSEGNLSQTKVKISTKKSVPKKSVP